jgi:hypothetical protein
MKFCAASVPRAVRSAKLGHLPTNAIIGMWHIANPRGGFQVFDVVMQLENDFRRMQNHLATLTPMGTSPESGKMNLVYAVKDVKEIEIPDGTPDAAKIAADHFRQLFKVNT